MSGVRGIFTDGQAATATDESRIGTAASQADDLVYENVTSDSPTKFLVPEGVETDDNNPRLIVQSAGAPYRINPFFFSAKSATNAKPYLSGHHASVITGGSVPNPASGGGSTRYDLLYARLTTSSTTVSRKVKQLDGTITTESLDVAKTPVITFALIADVDSMDPTADLPADTGSFTAGDFYMPLAYFEILTSYASGTLLPQSKIVPLWTGGAFNESWQRGFRYGTLVDAADDATATTPITSRWNAWRRMLVPAVHTDNPQTATLDEGIDWNRRLIIIHGFRAPKETGELKAIENIGTSGYSESFSTGPMYCFRPASTGSTNIYVYTYQHAGETSKTLTFKVERPSAGTDPGRLNVTFNDAPSDGTNGDNWVFIVEATDQAVF